MIDDRVPTHRFINPDVDPHKRITAELCHQRSKPAMPTGSPATLDTNRARRKVKLIADHDNIRDIDPKPPLHPGNDLSASVHVGQRFQEPDGNTGIANEVGAQVAAKQRSVKPAAMRLCDCVQRKKPGVMPGLCIVETWVSKANDKPQTVTLRNLPVPR